MTTKKTTPKLGRKKATGKADDDIVKRYDLTVHYVPIGDLKKYPNNPNVGGSEEAVNESLRELGQYMPLRVQKSTMYILGGNHTYDELVKLGATEAACFLYDVDDVEAKKIVVGDNHIGTLANIDRYILADLMVSLPDPRGTGITEEEMSVMERMHASAMKEMEDLGGEDGALARIHRESLGGIDAPEADGYEEDYEAIAEEDGPVTDLKKVSEELAGMYDLKDNMLFDSNHPMGYPPLRHDMMIEDLPMPIDSWAGSATRDDPRGDQVWWLYNFGIDSTSGMADLSKIIMSFYCWDDYYENWWNEPSKYVGRMLNSRIKYAVTPNWSMFSDDAFAVNVFNLYRSRWIGRYMQEVGIRVMPDLQWTEQDPRAREVIDKHTSYGLPKPLKWGALQAHTNSENLKDPKLRQMAKDEYLYMVDKLEVENLLVYSGKPGQELFSEIEDKIGCKLLMLDNRTMKLSERQRGREKKTTI